MSGDIKGAIITMRRNVSWEVTDVFERMSSLFDMANSAPKTQAPDTSSMKWAHLSNKNHPRASPVLGVTDTAAKIQALSTSTAKCISNKNNSRERGHS